MDTYKNFLLTLLLMTHHSFHRDPKKYTGNFAIDEDVLKEHGIKDLAPYACDPSEYTFPSVLRYFNFFTLLEKDIRLSHINIP